MVVEVSVPWAAVRSRTAVTPGLSSAVGADAPVQNLSFRVVGVVSDPERAELIFTLNVDTPEVATTFKSLSMVTVPPESPLMVSVKEAALLEVEKDPAKPLLSASV